MKLSDVVKRLVETMATYGDLELEDAPTFRVKAPQDDEVLRKMLEGDRFSGIATPEEDQAKADAAPSEASSVRMNDTPVRVPIVQNARR